MVLYFTLTSEWGLRTFGASEQPIAAVLVQFNRRVHWAQSCFGQLRYKDEFLGWDLPRSGRPRGLLFWVVVVELPFESSLGSQDVRLCAKGYRRDEKAREMSTDFRVSGLA